MTRRYRLPLPTTDWLTPAEALRKARLRRPLLRGDREGGEAGVLRDLDVDTVAESPAESDGMLWSPSAEMLARLPDPHVFDKLRSQPEGDADAKLVLVLPQAEEARAVQALSEAGYVLLRRDAVRSEAGDSIWLTARADKYRVRLCTADDEAPILELFAPLFHVARSPAHWRWKYLDNPWGRRWISLAESTGGELAAHYAGYPVPFVRWHGGRREDLLAVHIGDTMTAPEHRQVGLGWTSLLGRAVRHHFATFGRTGIAFYYGFNTGKIRHFNLRFIQGRWAGTVGHYRRPMTGISGSSGAAERIELGAADDFGAFFDAVGPRYGDGDEAVLVRRDADWLRWRYATCPDEPRFFALAVRHRGRLVGWGVFRAHDQGNGRRVLRWVDALFEPEHAHRAAGLLDAALAQPEAVGAEEIVAWFSPRPHWWLEQLDALGFERVAEPDDLGLIYLPFGHDDVDDFFPNVYYTWGDCDLT